MKINILLLVDVFENFRLLSLKEYKLDPAHYYTAPGLTWDAMLRHTGIQLELLTDIDMIMFVERGIRGGISQCSNRYSKANNKYLKDFNPDESTKFITYVDANNLYGWSMTQHMPKGNFKWVENVDNNFDFNVPDDSPIGFFLEVDLEYPQYLHDRHSDLPFCAENIVPPGSKIKKLLTTLDSKKKYILHYRNLKQALKNGLILTKIYRVIQFDQSEWLKTYIDLNTNLRMQASNIFEKNFFKLMNNACFGKTMENVRKYKDVRLITSWDKRYGAEALIAKPNFHSRSIFSENLVAIQLNKKEVFMDKAIYVGLMYWTYRKFSCMISIMIICYKNMVKIVNYYTWTLIVFYMN